MPARIKDVELSVGDSSKGDVCVNCREDAVLLTPNNQGWCGDGGKVIHYGEDVISVLAAKVTACTQCGEIVFLRPGESR